MIDQAIRVLLIEDNPGDARLFEDMLAQATSSRFELVHVERLAEGLSWLESASFDVLLLDLYLPDAYGFETFERTYEKAAQLPIILLTGLDDEDLALAAVRKGAQDYLVKGEVDESLLRRAIRYAIERKRAEAHIKASLREKDVLLQEIHHRVKNNLQIISSLLNLQSRTIQDQRVLEIFQECRNRVYSMALVHETLYRSKSLDRIDFSEYAHSLAKELYKSYGASTRTIALETHIDTAALSIDTAGPIGLILNELLSNCLKHAFPTGGPGEIQVELRASDNNRYSLTISDNGVGLPEDLDLDTTTSLGLRLVGALIQQLDGTVEVHRNAGTCLRVTFADC